MLSAFSRMLLIEGLDDWVPLAALGLGFFGRSPSPHEFLVESRAAVEPLLRQGLMTMGDLRGLGGYEPWALSIDECLANFEEMFMSDPDLVSGRWKYGIWLCLTSQGGGVGHADLC